jgi:hypothetical protein
MKPLRGIGYGPHRVLEDTWLFVAELVPRVNRMRNVLNSVRAASRVGRPEIEWAK